MKKYLLLAAGLSAAVFFSSCKKDEPNPNGGGFNVDTLVLSLSTNSIEMNEYDYVTLTVRDKSGNDITNQCTLYENNTFVIEKDYVPTRMGNVVLSAKLGSKVSNLKILNVVDKTPSPYTQKIVVEDFTGTWCQYCPRVANILKQFAQTNDNLVTVYVHGGDPFSYQYVTPLRSAFQATGWPFAVLNRKLPRWNETTTSLNSALAGWAPVGLSISSTNNGSTVSGTVKVKFNVNTKKPLKLFVALLENGRVSPQSNAYPQLGNTPTINDYVHDHIMRKAATDIFGDPIPVSAQTKNNVYEFPYIMTNSGSLEGGGQYTADLSKCEIVAYVVDASSPSNGTLNVQKVKVGLTQDFD
jgi:thiol-disulfide isomerase/thioredoxin